MKNIIKHTVAITCFLLMASLTSQAQQATTAKEKTAGGNAQKTGTAATVSKPAETKLPETKNLETLPATQTGSSMQNADRPKASTIVPDKKQRPLANEGPKTPDQQ